MIFVEGILKNNTIFMYLRQESETAAQKTQHDNRKTKEAALPV